MLENTIFNYYFLSYPPEEAASEESQEIPSQGDEPNIEGSMDCLFCNSNFMNSSALEDHLRISVSCMKAVSEHMKELEKSANKNEQTSKDSKMSKKLQSESGKSISHISRVKVVFVKVCFLSVVFVLHVISKSSEFLGLRQKSRKNKEWPKHFVFDRLFFEFYVLTFCRVAFKILCIVLQHKNFTCP